MAKKKQRAPQPGSSAGEAAELPTLEHLLADGYTEREAHGMLAGIAAKKAGRSQEECDAAYESALAEYDASASEPAGKQGEPAGRDPTGDHAPVRAHDRPFYRVVATSPRGTFYRIGRGFGRTPTDICVDELTPEERKELEASNPSFLSVVLIEG